MVYTAFDTLFLSLLCTLACAYCNHGYKNMLYSQKFGWFGGMPFDHQIKIYIMHIIIVILYHTAKLN